jgi:hypothetical protein
MVLRGRHEELGVRMARSCQWDPLRPQLGPPRTARVEAVNGGRRLTSGRRMDLDHLWLRGGRFCETRPVIGRVITAVRGSVEPDDHVRCRRRGCGGWSCRRKVGNAPANIRHSPDGAQAEVRRRWDYRPCPYGPHGRMQDAAPVVRRSPLRARLGPPTLVAAGSGLGTTRRTCIAHIAASVTDPVTATGIAQSVPRLTAKPW